MNYPKLPSTEDYEKAKKDLLGTMATAKSANTGQPIYGLVVNVRLCMSGILVDLDNGGWVRCALLEDVKPY